MRLGVAHHFGWAVVVAATDDHVVVDRRRIELIGPGLPNAPIHHEGGTHAMHGKGSPPSDDALADLVAQVRLSVTEVTTDAFAVLAEDVGEEVESISLRSWPDDFPTDIAVLRRVPYESRADSVMYLEIMAEVSRARRWTVHHYDAGNVEAQAISVLGDRAEEILHGPRSRLGPPWSKDHRTALAATILATTAR